MLPAFRGIYHETAYDYADLVSEEVTNPYISQQEQPLSVDEIVALLHEYNLLNPPGYSMSQRYWPGDKEDAK